MHPRDRSTRLYAPSSCRRLSGNECYTKATRTRTYTDTIRLHGPECLLFAPAPSSIFLSLIIIPFSTRVSPFSLFYSLLYKRRANAIRAFPSFPQHARVNVRTAFSYREIAAHTYIHKYTHTIACLRSRESRDVSRRLDLRGAHKSASSPFIFCLSIAQRAQRGGCGKSK